MSKILETFFNDISKTDLLTREEEVELSKLIESGDKPARDRMIKANLRLAISIAKKYQHHGCALEDLIQESNIGLMKAVDRFDWRKGFKFSTYACWWIKQSVRRHITAQSSSIKLPSYAKSLLWKAKSMSEEYFEEFGVHPTQEEVADLVGVSIKTLKNVISSSSTPISLDACMSYSSANGSSTGRSFSEKLKDHHIEKIETQLDHARLVTVVKESLSMLSDREEKIIRLRFGISEDPTDDATFPITKLEAKKMSGASTKGEF